MERDCIFAVPRKEGAVRMSIDAGGVNNDARPDAENLDGLAHGVGGSAGRGIHYGDLLSRDSVDKGTLAVVPPSENADMRLAVFSFHLAAKVQKIVKGYRSSLFSSFCCEIIFINIFLFDISFFYIFAAVF